MNTGHHLEKNVISFHPTVWNVSKYGFFSGPYSVRMRENTDQKKLGIWTLFPQSICWPTIWRLKFFIAKHFIASVFSTVAEIRMFRCLELISHECVTLLTSLYGEWCSQCLLFVEELDSQSHKFSYCPLPVILCHRSTRTSSVVIYGVVDFSWIVFVLSIFFNEFSMSAI